METFDEYFERKMKFGKYQYLVMCLGFLLHIAIGSFLVMMPSVLRLIQYDNTFTFFEISFLSSIDTVGTLIAGLLTGHFLNFFGRKKVLAVGTLIGVFAGILLFFTHSFVGFLVVYFLLGICIIGVTNSIMLYMIETFTGNNKRKAIVGVYAFFTVGRLFGTIVARAAMSTYQFDYWKIPLLANSTILSICFVLVAFFMKESVKFSYYKNDLKKAAREFNEIMSINYSNTHILENRLNLSLTRIKNMKKIEMRKQASKSEIEQKNEASSCRNNFVLSTILVFLFAVTMFIFEGHYLAVANILGTDHNALSQNILIIGAEVVGSFLVAVFIENPKVGRKRILSASYLLLVFIFVVPFFDKKPRFFETMLLSKVFLKSALATLVIHLNEAFPIQKRDRSVLMIQTIASFFIALFPFLFYKVFSTDKLNVFALFALIAISGFAGSSFLESDLKLKKVFDSDCKSEASTCSETQTQI